MVINKDVMKAIKFGKKYIVIFIAILIIAIFNSKDNRLTESMDVSVLENGTDTFYSHSSKKIRKRPTELLSDGSEVVSDKIIYTVKTTEQNASITNIDFYNTDGSDFTSNSNDDDLNKKLVIKLDKLIKKLENSSSDNKLDIINKAWKVAADLHAPENALVALKALTFDKDNTVAALAQQAINDLNKFSENINIEYSEISSPEGDSSDTAVTKADIQNIDSKKINKQNLIATVITGETEGVRAQALQEVLVYRDNDLPGTLLVVFNNNDPSPSIRKKIVHEIWKYLIDNKPHNRQLVNSLYIALNDPSDEVSLIAKMALTDVNKAE